MDALNVAVNCDQKQLASGCRQVDPVMPFSMHSFDDKMVCGRRGGLPFMKAVRPDQFSHQCPSGYSPCSIKTKVDNTFCYDSTLNREHECPVTALEIVQEPADCSLPEAVKQSFTEGYSLCYSKDADSMPASVIKVETLKCADPFFQM